MKALGLSPWFYSHRLHLKFSTVYFSLSNQRNTTGNLKGSKGLVLESGGLHRIESGGLHWIESGGLHWIESGGLHWIESGLSPVDYTRTTNSSLAHVTPKKNTI